MNNTILNIIYSLFELHNVQNIFWENSEILSDQIAVKSNTDDFQQALSWIKSLLQYRTTQYNHSTLNNRTYSPHEMTLLNCDVRAYLTTLLQHQIIDLSQHEHIITHALQFCPEEISLKRIKWVTLMFLSQTHESSELIEKLSVLPQHQDDMYIPIAFQDTGVLTK